MAKLFIIFFSAVLLISCEKDSFFLWGDPMDSLEDEAYIFAPSPVFDVIAPSSVKFGEPVKIQVRSQGNSGCAGFSHFIESKTGRSTYNIRVVQKSPREDFCTTILTTITSSYEFMPEVRQKYTLNFWRGELYENDFITVLINVR
jgi:hypothetical protein